MIKVLLSSLSQVVSCVRNTGHDQLISAETTIFKHTVHKRVIYLRLKTLEAFFIMILNFSLFSCSLFSLKLAFPTHSVKFC
jgi:hypothetical protein